MASDKRQFGDLCEDIVVKQLVKHNHRILDRNYSRKWGEIDIVSREVSRPHTIHFIEVKGGVSRETNVEWIRPEEHVNYWKLKRLWRAVQTWLAEKKIADEIEWQIDVASVLVDRDNGNSDIRWINNIVIE